MRFYEDYELPSASELAADEEPRPPCGGPCPPWGCHSRRCWQDAPHEPDEEEGAVKYDPLCECCHARPKMDRCDCCEECWYSGRYSRMRDNIDREVRLEEERNADLIERDHLRGIRAPDY